MAFIILDNEPDDLLSELLSKVDQRVRDLLEKHGEVDGDGEGLDDPEDESDSQGVEEDIDEIQKFISTSL